MALLFSTSIKPLYVGVLNFSMSTSNSITVYSGVQPDAATIAGAWGSYNSEAEGILWHQSGFGFVAPSTTSSSWNATTIPATIAPLANGTATWCIIWYGAITIATVKGTTLPGSSRFIVADVSSTSGTGCVRFASTTFSTATPITVVDAGFTVY